MEQLNATLGKYIARLPQLRQQWLYEQMNRIADPSAYPFNPYEFAFTHLIDAGVLTIEDYQRIREDYLVRNPYLYLFEMAPRTFGQEWGEQHMRTILPEAEKAGKHIDPAFQGEYDLWFNGLRIEVKASRAVRKKGGRTLAQKALFHGATDNFDMNFQQLKPGCCDALIWIAVWRDFLDYWILTPEQVRNHPEFSNQHRGGSTDPDGKPIEGQIHINRGNYTSFEKYRVSPELIADRLKTINNH